MNILEAQELRRGKKSVRPFSLPPVGAAPLTAPAGPAPAPAAASAPVIPPVPAATAIQSQPNDSVLEKDGFIAANVEQIKRSIESNSAQKRIGRAAAGIGESLGTVAEIPRGVANIAKSAAGMYTGKPLSPLNAEKQKKLDAEVAAEFARQSRYAQNPIIDKDSGFFKRGWFGGVGSIAGWIANLVGGLDEAVAVAGAGAAGGAAIGGAITAPAGGIGALPSAAVGATSGFGAGLTAGSAKEWYYQGQGESYLEMVKAGIDKDAARTVSAVMAVPYAGIEYLFNKIPGVGAVFDVGAKKTAQVAARGGMKNAAKAAFLSTIFNTPGEASEEALQSANNDIAFNLAAKISAANGGDEVAKKQVGEIVDNAWINFRESILPSMMMIGGGAVASIPGNIRPVPQDPNAPKVNPILNPEAAPSVFDAPVGAQPSQDATAVNPLLAQNQPTTNAEDEATVRRALDARGPAYAGIRAVEPAPSAGVAAVKEISDKIGLRVIWIDGAPVGGRAIQGAAPEEAGNTIFLHTDLLTNPKRDPVMMVYAHELTHRSERASPKEYGILRDSVLARAEARASVEEKVASGMSRAAAESEAVAEQVEVLGTDQAFWQEVFAGKEQSFIEHIIQIVTDMAQRVFGTNQAAKAEAIRGAAVSAFQALQAQNQGQNQNQNQPTTTQEAANGVQEGQAQEVAQPLQATATAEAAITGTPDIKAPPEAKAAPAPKPSRSEVAKLRREAEAAKVERARLRESKRKAEIEYNKKFKGSGLTRRQAAKARRIYDYDRGDAPILNAIIEQFGGIRAEDAAKYEIETSSLPKSIRSKLFPAKGGADWNSIIWAIENDNLLPGVLRADEVGYALSKEIKSLQMRAKDEKALVQSYRQRSADERGFKRAIIRNDKNAKVRREAVDLREGDVLVRKIEGIPVEFTVSEVEDTTGNIVLKSTLYGEQPVEFFEMVHADKLIRSEDAVDGAEDVPFSTKDATEDEGGTLADTASSIEDDADRDAFARAELEKRAGVPLVKGPKNLAALSQNHVVATAKDLMERLASGEIDAVEAMESLEAVEKRVGAATKRADAKAAREAKAAGESRQQGLPGLEGLAKSPYGTPDDGANGTLFSAKKLTDEDVEEESRRKASSSIQGNRDAEYLAAVERGDMETAQRMVDEAAKRAGYTVGPVWHGGAAGFNVFDWSKMGQQGTSEGKGFYFTNDRDLAKGYADRHGGRLMRVYLRGGKRIDGHKLTFTVSQVKRILTDVHNRSEAQEEGSSPLWNFGDIGYEGKSAVIDKAARNTVKYSKDDVSLLAGLINSGADPESLYDSVYRVTGKTGIVEQDAWGRPGHEVHVATSASHVKLADPVTRDDAGRVIPLSQRFNPQRDDIRFSLAKDDGEGRTREYSISRYFRETLKREWSASYKQKSAQQAIGELSAITEKQGEDWVMDHLFDLSKETQAEFPMALRPLAARHIIESADKAFRAWGVNDDGSNLPGNPAIDKLWLKIEDIRNKAAAYEREGGRGMAWLRSTYEANNVNSPVGVRKTVNKLHDKLAAPVIGPVKAPIIEKASGELKAAYDEAITALEEERKRNSELEESLRVLDEALGKRISQNEARIKQRAAKSEAYRRGIDEDLAATMEELKAAGMSLEGLSSKPTIEMIQKAVKLYIGIHGADQAKVAAFLNRNLGEKLAPATVKALINDAQLALDNAGRAAEKAAPRKHPSVPRKGATVINRAPDMTIQPDKLGPQRLFDSGKMWGEGRVLNIGEADAKRLALELTEAGQTVMRGISSNVEVVISNALRHGRNAAGIEKVLVDSGIDPDTASRMVKNIVRRRAELVRPALETLRQKYAAKGDKVSRTIASAMDKIMSAMELADRASISQVSGFFDGNAWDESRRIIEEAFGFKSEITRDWFNETMRLYREYEKADEAGNHLRASVIHSEMLHRVARVQNGTGASLAVRSYIQGGMLWGPQTHWWNLFNTASRNVDAANAASIEQIIKAARAEKGKKLEYLKAAFAPWAIMGMSHKQAWGVAKYILKTGVNPLSMRIGDESKFGTDPKVASAPEWHPFFKKLGMRPFKYVGRALIAADSYFRTNIENTDIYLQAYNAAISRGESAPIAAKQALGMVGFVTDGTNDAYNEAARKADENGLKGADRDMNIRIELMNKLDPEMRDHAQKQGAAETFNDQNPEGLAGWIADHLRHHSSDPIIFYLGMFARIGANVFNYGLQTNPITGFLSLAKDSKFGRYKAGKTNVKLTSEERVRRTIRATQGLAMTGTILAMALSAAKDYDEDDDPNKKLKFGVSAVGPRDPAARKLWRQQHKPFMLTINGKEISYKWIAPLATPLALAGAIMDEVRFGSLKDAETDEAREESFLSALLPTMIMGLMSITTDELPGQGMVKFADMIYSGGQSGAQSVNAWNRFFQQQAASLGTAAIPYSALVRYFDRVYDPTVYTPNSIDGLKMYPYAFLRNMPFLRKAALYPMRNIFGEPIQVPDEGGDMNIGERAIRLMFDRFLNNMVEDPDIQFLTKVQRGFNAPSRKETRIVTNENGLYGLRNLTDAEYDRFLEVFGGELRRQVAEVRTAYTSSAEAEKWATPQNKALRKRLEDARSTAMNWAMYKFLTETGKQVVRNKE